MSIILNFLQVKLAFLILITLLTLCFPPHFAGKVTWANIVDPYARFLKPIGNTWVSEPLPLWPHYVQHVSDATLLAIGERRQ